MASPKRGSRPETLDQLALLYALVDHLQRARRVEDVYEEAAEGLRRVLAVDRSALLTREGAHVGMRVQGWAGLAPATRRVLEGYEPWAGERSDPDPVEVDLDAERQGQPVYNALRAEGLRRVLWLPLLHRGRVMGQLLLGRSSAGAFEAAEVRLAEVIAGHVAFSIWRTRSDEDRAELLRRFEAERSVLESVVNQMPAGVLLADVPSGRIITSNPQVTAIWGKTLRHASQISDYDLWGGRDSRGEPLDPHRWPLARSVEHGETVRGEEIRIVRGDGSSAVIRMSAAPVVDSQGRQLAAVATVYDVTRERDEEQRQAFLEEATASITASIELEPTLRAIAGAALGPWGDWTVLYRVAEERIESIRAFHRDPDLAEGVANFTGRSIDADTADPVARALRRRAPLLLSDPEEAAEAVAGREPALVDLALTLGCDAVAVLPLAARGEALGALVVVRADGRYSEGDLELLAELARRCSLALENALLYGRALAADRAKASFLAVMSHEFRTPLSAILGYADILTARVHGELNPKQQTHMDRIKASVRHLSHLVDEILSFASMEAGREKVTLRTVDLRALVADVSAIMEPIAEAAGLELHVELPDHPTELRTDPQKVRQIVINLVSNALKYTPAGAVAVDLVESDDQVACHVTDTGPGIAPDHVERVFEPYWQVDQSDGRHVTGTGLGLAVARRLAHLLGGDLTLRSEVGKGSRFTLVLPKETAGEPGVATDPAS